MTSHPYLSAPDRAFWSRSVATNWRPAEAVTSAVPLLTAGERVMSAGSCFAANLVPYLERAGFEYLRTERPHAAFASCADEALSYGKFSAAYGNIYTARQLKQTLARSLGQFHPAEDRWLGAGVVIDPFRPGLRFKARSQQEFDAVTRQHLGCVRAAFVGADVLIFTLGLTEAWVSRIDGAVFPACPGTIFGEFDPARHQFHNFSASETTQDLDDFIVLLRAVNPKVRIILTVSPVPLVATATAEHVLVATAYSKSALRVAAHEVSSRHKNVRYFPAYEIVTGPQAPPEFFDETRRNVSAVAVQTVMDAFLAHCEGGEQARMSSPQPEALTPSRRLSQSLVEAECEEGFADQS